MHTILQNLYYGKICPAEQYQPTQEEFKEKRMEHSRHYTEFIETLEHLEPPLDKRFIEIMDEQLDTIPMNFSSMFIDGFCLGAQMMLEILHNPNSRGL